MYDGAKLIVNSASPASLKEGRSVGWSESARVGRVGSVDQLVNRADSEMQKSGACVWMIHLITHDNLCTLC